MRYVAAYLLAVLGGNDSPTAKNIKKILNSVGIDADDERVNKVISELSGKDVDDVINSGKNSFKIMLVRWKWTEKSLLHFTEEKKEEEKKEESEESDEDMGFGLFD
ncbi:PREDICTED: 60S acidic ribosomal protein P2-like [Gavialis gangeticus]|uniref:60S acidic ribosomal protein P2-like n=1 Tax=Gavialis gangeticus TaxID=94835 RepID=UPI00092F9BD7|nr:PREDICTED: 60S acidic ribosomal protein P2-like [Gavialis gangeticus]